MAGSPLICEGQVNLGMTDLDAALSTVAHGQCRLVLLALLDHNPQTVSRLSIPEDVHPGDEEIEKAEVEMHHIHLPRLEDAGFIEWNKDDRQVMKGPRYADIKPLLEVLTDNAGKLPDGEL